MRAKLDAESREDLEDTITTLEDLGWDVTNVSVDGEPGAMLVDLHIIKRNSKHQRLKTATGGLETNE